jgi:ABC-type sugar transport system ATPase subunit
LGLIQNMRRQRNVSVILIVHNYNQVFEVCDRLNFLHSGEIVLDASTSETTEEELIRIVKSVSVARRFPPQRSGLERVGKLPVSVVSCQWQIPSMCAAKIYERVSCSV